MSKALVNRSRVTTYSQIVDFSQLVKLRLNLIVVFSTVVAYLIASGQHFEYDILLNLAVGGFLITGAANALNQVIESDLDGMMKRTANRPIAAGRMSREEGILWAGMMTLVGITLLTLINQNVVILSIMALVSYAFIYTPLKRINSIAVFVGAVPGALPTLIGVTAFEGSVGLLAIALFSVQFLWQFPHFWAIAYLGFDDYEKGGFKFIPKRDSFISIRIAIESIVYAFILLLLGAVLYYSGIANLASSIIFAILTLMYLGFAINFYRNFDKSSALRLMLYSLAYLPMVLIVLYLNY